MKNCLQFIVEPKRLREFLIGSCVAVLLSAPTSAEEPEYTTVGRHVHSACSSCHATQRQNKSRTATPEARL